MNILRWYNNLKFKLMIKDEFLYVTTIVLNERYVVLHIIELQVWTWYTDFFVPKINLCNQDGHVIKMMISHPIKITMIDDDSNFS